MGIESVVDEFIRRVTSHDVDGACELLHPDVEYDNVPVGKNLGIDAVKAFLAPMVGGIDETEWVVHRQAVTGNLVMNERNDRFRIGDSWMELPVAGVFEVDASGLITLWRDYFDMETFTSEMAKLLS